MKCGPGGRMFGRIALFELRYQLRRPIALISFLLFAALGFGLFTALATKPPVLDLPVNAPLNIGRLIGVFSIISMFLSVAILGDVALRDAETHMDAIVRTKPVRSGLYFGARFTGAYAIACLSFMGAALGLAMACMMPWVHPRA